MKICNRNTITSVPHITYLSSIYHNTHTRKGGLLLHRPPLCRWSRILLLNFCNSIDNPQGNQCRARSIIIVQYTFTTSHRLSIFRPVCMELSMIVQKPSCMLVYPNYTKSVRQNFVFWKGFRLKFYYIISDRQNLCFWGILAKRKEPLPCSNSSEPELWNHWVQSWLS